MSEDFEEFIEDRAKERRSDMFTEIEFVSDLPLSRADKEELEFIKRRDILFSTLRSNPENWALFAHCESSIGSYDIFKFICKILKTDASITLETNGVWYKYEFKEIYLESNEIEFYARAIRTICPTPAKKKFWRRR